jgi:hypothetical protein
MQYTDLNTAQPSGNTQVWGKGKQSNGFFAAEKNVNLVQNTVPIMVT